MAELSTRSGGGARVPSSPVVSTHIVGPDLSREKKSPYEMLGFIDPSETTQGAINIINNLYTDDGKLLVDIDLDNKLWADRNKLMRALHAQSRLSEYVLRFQGTVDLERLSELDLVRISERLESYRDKGALRRMFDKSFQESQQVLSRVMSVSNDVEQVLESLKVLKDVQELMEEVAGYRRIWSKLLGQTPTADEKRDPKFWIRSSQFILAIADFIGCCNENPDAGKLRKLMVNPKPVYRAFAEE